MKRIRKITPKDLKIKALRKTKDVFLKTPHETVKLTESGEPEYAENGDPVFIPVIHPVPLSVAKKKLKQGAGEVDLDEETGEITQVLRYEIASEEEVKQYQEQCRIYQNKRNKEIRSRAMRKAKHIVQVSQDEVTPTMTRPPEVKEETGELEESKPNPDDIDSVKKIADDLGVEYAPNIGIEKLRARIKAHVEKEED